RAVTFFFIAADVADIRDARPRRDRSREKPDAERNHHNARDALLAVCGRRWRSPHWATVPARLRRFHSWRGLRCLRRRGALRRRGFFRVGESSGETEGERGCPSGDRFHAGWLPRKYARVEA